MIIIKKIIIIIKNNNNKIEKKTGRYLKITQTWPKTQIKTLEIHSRSLGSIHYNEYNENNLFINYIYGRLIGQKLDMIRQY